MTELENLLLDTDPDTLADILTDEDCLSDGDIITDDIEDTEAIIEHIKGDK